MFVFACTRLFQNRTLFLLKFILMYIVIRHVTLSNGPRQSWINVIYISFSVFAQRCLLLHSYYGIVLWCSESQTECTIRTTIIIFATEKCVKLSGDSWCVTFMPERCSQRVIFPLVVWSSTFSCHPDHWNTDRCYRNRTVYTVDRKENAHHFVLFRIYDLGANTAVEHFILTDNWLTATWLW